MRRCPLSYEPVGEGEDYSVAGLRLLDRRLVGLARLELSAEQQRQEAIARAGKMSIQGIQLKLSALLEIKAGRLTVVDRNGRLILKPPSLDFPELPENEDLTMRLAAVAGIEVPVHGLIYAVDGSLTYLIRRFDREGRVRLPVEDFSQLAGASRQTKYDSSMEQVAALVDRHCTFPILERSRLFERTLFSFLVGNEDMHLKNFSLIVRNQKVELAPAYDLLNTTIALPNPKEELALPLHGKKSRLTRKDLLDYFARDRLRIQERVLTEVIGRFQTAFPTWDDLIARSFLSPAMKEKYRSVLAERKARLGFRPG